MVELSRHDEQIRQFNNILLLNSDKYPDIRKIFGVINNIQILSPAIQRQIGKNMDAQMRRPGVPDICVPIASGDYSIMWIEHKIKKYNPKTGNWIKYGHSSTLNDDQKEYQSFLSSQKGHKHVVTYNLEDLVNAVNDYLQIDLKWHKITHL